MQLIRSYYLLAIKLPAMDPAAPRDTVAGASRSRLRRITFTRSPHDAEILRLAVPAFGALVAEPLFLLADAAIVGRIGTTALGGLGVASQALTTPLIARIAQATRRRPSGRASTGCGWPAR